MHLPFREEEQEIEEGGKFMNSEQLEEILQYFQIWRLKAAIASFQPMKAAGPDGLNLLCYNTNKGWGTGHYNKLF